MTVKRILIADDELIIRSFLIETLSRKNFDITLAENGQKAIELIAKQDFDLILTDMKMPYKTGLDVLQFARKKDPNTVVILMTAYGSIENAVDAMKEGAFNYLIKPFSPQTIETILEKAEEHIDLIKENRYLREEVFSNTKTPFITKSPAMSHILKNIEKAAKSNASIFISGESGTGKEVIAQHIHKNSLRNNRPFIKVNCPAIPETLIESEFFGYEKGAFTGANATKEGRFEIANKGTLLLDEVTEIPITLQAKLLRAIQEQEFERVGGIKPISVNIRFISTTNRNIKNAIEQKIFREDLFYRLNVVPIHIPSLRERKEDIIPLAEFFLQKFCKENHKPLKKLSEKAEKKLLNYSWPGNVRELANIIERTVVMDFAKNIEQEHLYLDMKDLHDTSGHMQAQISLKELEKRHILATLETEKHNRTKAAKVLGITIRTLRNKIKEYQTKEIQKELF